MSGASRHPFDISTHTGPYGLKNFVPNWLQDIIGSL